MEVILIEVPDEVGGYGSKGVGEIGLVPTAGAVAGALYAFDGKRRFRLPDDRCAGGGALGAEVPARLICRAIRWRPRHRRGRPESPDGRTAPDPLPRSASPHAERGAGRRLHLRSPGSQVAPPRRKLDLSAVHFSRRAATPVGPAAGPHTQLAQNIVLAWLAGGRIIELKTVQIKDKLRDPPTLHPRPQHRL